jgi:hypothetical protein
MEELKYKVGIETDRITPEQLIDPSAISTLVQLNEQIEQYKNELKSLTEVEKEQGQLTEDQKKQQEQLKLALKDAQTEYRNVQKEIQNVDAAVKSNIKTYDGLVKENKALMDAMRQLPLDDTTGELKRLQDQYNANNDELKKFDATLGNHQRNVGNYSSALSGFGGALSKIPGPIGTVAQSFMGFSAVLKANPIGLVITAISFLIEAFNKFQPIIDFATKQFQILTNIVKFFVEQAGAALGLVEASNMSLAETVRITAALADAEVRLRDAKRDQIVLDAQRNKEISELRLQEADRNRTEEERIAILQKIEQIEREGLDEKIRLAKEELRIAEDRAAINHSDAATLEDIANKRATLIRLETDSNNFLREQITKRTELEKRLQAEAKARSDKAAQERQRLIELERRALDSLKNAREAIDEKLFEELRKMQTGELDAAIDLTPKLDLEDATKKSMVAAILLNDTLKVQTLARLEEEGKLVESAEMQKLFRIQELTALFAETGVSEYQASLDAKYQADLEYEEKLKAAKEAELEIAKQVEEGKKQAAISSANSIVSIGESIFGKTKALAVAQAIIDTYAAANSAAKNTPGGVLAKSLAAAAMIIKGIVNVKKILSTKPGSKSVGAAGTSAATAVQPPSPFALGFQNEGMVIPNRMQGTPFATGMAVAAGQPGFSNRDINIQANVDRRGLAIAVREGERSIRTQQFDYR